MTQTETAIQVRSGDAGGGELAGAVSLLPVGQMQVVLAEYSERRTAFRAWLLAQLREGVHFGVPPGCEPKRNHHGQPTDWKNNVIAPEQWTFKPSLYKAGADFVCDLMMVDAAFDPDEAAWRMGGGKQGTYYYRCRLLCRGGTPFHPDRDKGDVLGEGRGAAAAGDKKRDDNAAVKIAQKCAKVDAVIHAFGLSDLFTQDLEDARQRAEPNPAPEYDDAAPQAATRDERRQAAAAGVPPEVNGHGVAFVELTKLRQEFRDANGLAGRDEAEIKAEFAHWAKTVVGRERMDKFGSWTAEDVQRCRGMLS